MNLLETKRIQFLFSQKYLDKYKKTSFSGVWSKMSSIPSAIRRSILLWLISFTLEMRSIFVFSGIFANSSFQISYSALAPCHNNTFFPARAFCKANSPASIDLPDPVLPKTKLCE
ncbi:hypothetical protein ND861_17790 [Leptospira sp. 2 VSF19]|uniref:Uncharacterized protein n=1 Tax=Leptospira soteropolitanensis TaxID=2950025 RepID=A0ABT3MMU7_9LEPT|nr:hypothetical protein [Leptospira soteropolitanensis]MCW7528213.1 hypothetical protein [Leptospira soteropolitanensis]